MAPDKLVTMANDIAAFFRAYPPERAVAGIADHLRQFWDPRMRAKLEQRLARDASGVDPLVALALRRLTPPGDAG